MANKEYRIIQFIFYDFKLKSIKIIQYGAAYWILKNN